MDDYKYDADTGQIVGKTGHPVGRVHRNGYVYIHSRTLGNIRAHKLAWRLHYGEWPAQIIDHINGDRSDNRIDNLRLVSHELNCHNSDKPGHSSKTGIRGVSAHPNGKFRAKFGHKQLGYFTTAEEAKAAYEEAKRKRVHSLLRDLEKGSS